MRQYDPLLGWYTRLPRKDQMALVQAFEEAGNYRLANIMYRVTCEGIYIKDFLIVYLWELGIKDIWRTAKGKVASDAAYLSQKAKTFAEASEEFAEDTIDSVKKKATRKRHPLDGMHIHTRQGLINLARSQCQTGDCADWDSYFPDGPRPPGAPPKEY